MYQLQNYLDMMTDQHRMVPLEAAIRNVVRTGDTVLDLGAGTGVLTFIALDAGAAHVYAVESSSTIEVARQVARANGLADRITFIHADARAIQPPRRVDGMIGDVRGILPLLGDNIELFELVRDRWLKPGGYTVPLADELFVAPVSATGPRAAVDGWKQPRREADYSGVAEVAANGFQRVRFDPDDLLADGQPFGEVRYDGSTARKLGARPSFTMRRTGTLTGLGMWFHGTLTPEIGFDTSPMSPPSVYAQAFFPLTVPRAVEAGQTIHVGVTAHRTPSTPIWGWTVASDRAPAWRESHSTLKSTFFGQPSLDWLAGTRSPALSDAGLVAQHVLAATDGRLTARELAVRLAGVFPQRFPSADDALPAVIEVLERFAAP